jgi:hypothetical protein
VSGKRKATIKAAPTPEQAAKIAKPSPVKPGPFTYPRTEREVVIEFEITAITNHPHVQLC